MQAVQREKTIELHPYGTRLADALACSDIAGMN
jgi:hypothetical protein